MQVTGPAVVVGGAPTFVRVSRPVATSLVTPLIGVPSPSTQAIDVTAHWSPVGSPSVIVTLSPCSSSAVRRSAG